MTTYTNSRFDYFIDGDGYYDFEMEGVFRDFMNDVYDPYVIGNMNFYAGDILESCDPTAFRQAYLEWLDNKISEGFIQENED